MANKTLQIRIESILGGHAELQNFPNEGEFLGSVGIDPSQGNIGANNNPIATGSIIPVPIANISSSNLGNIPFWISAAHPKTSSVSYCYDASGSVYTAAPRVPDFTGLSDGGSMENSSGNGMAYYDNYIYFAKNTTVARYGPLNGTPAFDGNYWTSTLSKAALTHTTNYPAANLPQAYVTYPNHVMHRHSDGKLYFGDVVDNRGTIHYISTTKTSVEGDTDNGSTFGALTFGYGLWPTAIESYGSGLAIALYEGDGASETRGQRAKLAFWDTTSQNVNQITWVEFPDPVISAIKNINGVLYIMSGLNRNSGFRISRYVGGYSVEEVYYSSLGVPPFPGAVDGSSNQLLFGSQISLPSSNSPGCVYSFGLQNGVFTQKLFAPMRASVLNNSVVTALTLTENFGLGSDWPMIGWSRGNSGSSNNGVDATAGNDGRLLGTDPGNEWYSQVFRIGQPFQITRVRIPIWNLGTGDIITPLIFLDGAGTAATPLTTITNVKFPATVTNSSFHVADILVPPDGAKGHHSFFLGLQWTRGGGATATIELPIIIEYELLQDSHY